ncbi:MAG: biopolymer transporter ExbD [Phycisphaeraceae bacterium]
MAIKRLTEALEEQDDRADITPLIDVIFMLLLFFIITTTFAENTFFPIELPQAEGIELRTGRDAVTVEISREGEFALSGVSSRTLYLPDRERLYEALRDARDNGQARMVVIKADARAPAGQLIWIQHVLRQLEINESAFTAQPSQG